MPDTNISYTTQLVKEIIYRPQFVLSRTTQLIKEVIYKPTAGIDPPIDSALSTQIVVEVLFKN